MLILNQIRSYLVPIPPHYERFYDGCTYDFSGTLRKKGKISLKQTIGEFLFFEYTGQREATYISHMGFHYCTYDDQLSCIGLEISERILVYTIYEYLRQNIKLNRSSENDFINVFNTEIMEVICDEIYGDSLACEFFFCETMIDFLDIGDILLVELVGEENN